MNTTPAIEPTRVPSTSVAAAFAYRMDCLKRLQKTRERGGLTDAQSGWLDKHAEAITHLEHNFLPRGSGFDNGTDLDLERSSEDMLVFKTAFHHMNEHGMYTSWTDHTVRVKPRFDGIHDVTVTGRNTNGILEFIGDTFQIALHARIVAQKDGVSYITAAQ